MRICFVPLCLFTFATIVACADGNNVDDSEPDAEGIWSTPCPVDAPEFRTVDVGEVSLNVACQGTGPTVVMLHGFPEIWMGWSKVMDELAQTHRLIVPDQRGFNLSDRPEALEDYIIERLATDVAGLIDAVSNDPIMLVGHDWGGAVAWAAAHTYPERLTGLVIVNAPHPDVFARELANNPEQQSASTYMQFFMSDAAEPLLAANDFALLLDSFGGLLTDELAEAYKKAWAIPGALTAMLNWYRANLSDTENPIMSDVVIEVPTKVVWGMDDTALLPGNIIGLEDYVADLDVQKVPGASHWIAHEEPELVAKAIADWVTAAAAAP